MHVHHVPHVESRVHTGQPEKWIVEYSALESPYCNVMLSSAYPIHGSASKVNRSGANVQVVSCHHYLVIFHPIVEQLTVSGRVL